MHISTFIKKAILLLSFFSYAFCSYSQQQDTTRQILDISGTINANNNGFSLVPTFSLGKPAVQTGINISGNSRFSFHPQFWYSMLDYKPWSFIFIWRYKLINKEKFTFYLGTHAPGINFLSASVIEDSIPKDVIKARRFYPAVELTSNYQLRKNVSIGTYTILGTGIEEEISSNNIFFSVRMGFSDLAISEKLYLTFNPQIYYLQIDADRGLYTAAGLSLSHRNWPLSLTTMMNREIVSGIDVSKFEWNVGITYSFAKGFIER